MVIDGGIRMPSVPAPASEPRLTPSSYPRFFSSGSAILATVAQVAAEEPDTEPKMPQASTLTCIRRPGSQLSQGASPRNISSDSLVRNRISPIQMNSGSAASDHDALLPHTVVASTLPAGMPPPTNCMPAHPVAIRATAIQTPAPSSSARKPRRTAAIESSSTSDPALHGALDDLLGRLRFRQFVARREAAQHMEKLVGKGDEQDDEAAGVAELRNPQRHRDDALRNIGKFLRLPGHHRSMPGEEADEAGADHECGDLDIMADIVA